MTRHSNAGKGDTRRPQTVSDDKFKQNWNDIFKTKKVDNAKEAGQETRKPDQHLPVVR